jgi:hypothetical protein
MLGALFDSALSDQRNSPETMRRKRERLQFAMLTRGVEEKAKQLTSGTAFFNDMAGLHSDSVWHHQKQWYAERKSQRKQTRKTRQRNHFGKRKINVMRFESVNKIRGLSRISVFYLPTSDKRTMLQLPKRKQPDWLCLKNGIVYLNVQLHHVHHYQVHLKILKVRTQKVTKSKKFKP